jgi:hypothetical protein
MWPRLTTGIISKGAGTAGGGPAAKPGDVAERTHGLHRCPAEFGRPGARGKGNSMIPADFDHCFDALGLPRNATRARVRARYRRLLFIHHPDRNGDDQAARHRFEEITNAYRTLDSVFARFGTDHPLGRCRQCGDLEELFRAPEGDGLCRVCATDRRGRRGLPAPSVIVISCGASILGLMAAATLLILGLAAGRWTYVTASLIFDGLALGWLMVLCLSIRYTATREERQRSARAVPDR